VLMGCNLILYIALLYFVLCTCATETPLTLCATLQHSSKLILTLVGGGAHLDLRNKKGLTALHIAAQKDNDEAIRVRERKR